jgi:hypothetical protein
VPPTITSNPKAEDFSGFDWASLPPASLIVNVGGGIGHSSLTIAKLYPKNLRIVIQDLPHTIQEAKAVRGITLRVRH